MLIRESNNIQKNYFQTFTTTAVCTGGDTSIFHITINKNKNADPRTRNALRNALRNLKKTKWGSTMSDRI